MSSENKEQTIIQFASALVDDLLVTSDDALLAEAKEDHGSVDKALGEIDAEIEAAIKSLGKDRLAEARLAVAQCDQKDIDQVLDEAEARKQVEELISSSEFRARMTLAARNGKESCEHDILSAMSDLCELSRLSRFIPRPEFGSAPKAEGILKDLGVTDPKEIEAEAIAWHLGARVRYRSLQNCEARIVGAGDAAIITVDEGVSPQRKRFSVCHELGHWIHHRKRIIFCGADEIELPSADSASLERAADRFASELLMPAYLFVPIAQSLGRPSMHVVRRLSEIFNTSLSATAIRLVEINALPILLASHGRSGRRWFARSQSVTGAWMPRSILSHDSAAFTMIFGRAPAAMPPKSVSA